MISFVISLVALILGYLLYGRVVERIFAPDNRPTPAVAQADGVDYIVMPSWKVFMIPRCLPMDCFRLHLCRCCPRLFLRYAFHAPWRVITARARRHLPWYSRQKDSARIQHHRAADGGYCLCLFPSSHLGRNDCTNR